MRIIEATTWRVEFLLREPYTIAYQSYDRATNYFLRLVTDEGLVGNGCAAPAPEVTGEQHADTERALGDAAARLHGAEIMLAGSVDKCLAELLHGCPAAAAALDMARYDLLAQKANLPLYQFLGAHREEVMTSVTIGICGLQETRHRAQDLIRQGFRALKIKGGVDVEADIERLQALRSDLGAAIVLRFDANQGYTVEATMRWLSAISDCGIEMLEQPTPAGDTSALHALRAAIDTLPPSSSRLGVPALMADESLLGVRDAVDLAARGDFNAYNIKLMKAGGIDPARAIAAIAHAHGIPAMVSCMDEAALGIAAGLHFALSSRAVTWVDLDGHLDLIDDPTAGAVLLRDGNLSPNGKPGLGVELTA